MAASGTPEVKLTLVWVDKSGLDAKQTDVAKAEIMDIYAKAGVTVDIISPEEATSRGLSLDQRNVKTLQIVPDQRVNDKGRIDTTAVGDTRLGAQSGKVYRPNAEAAGKVSKDNPDLGRVIGRAGAHETGHMCGVADNLSSEKTLMKRVHSDPSEWSGRRSMEFEFDADDAKSIVQYLSGGK